MRGGASPPARFEQSMATLNGEIVMFGGFSGAIAALGDTWTWDGTGWTERSATGPAARAGHAMATVAGAVVMFGGYSASATYGDTWTFDGITWTPETLSLAPSARIGARIASF